MDANLLGLLDVVRDIVPEGKMLLVGCYILGLCPIWSSDFVFFGSERSYEERTHDATMSRIKRNIKLSVA